MPETIGHKARDVPTTPKPSAPPAAGDDKDELMREIDHEREKIEKKTEEMREAL